MFKAIRSFFHMLFSFFVTADASAQKLGETAVATATSFRNETLFDLAQESIEFQKKLDADETLAKVYEAMSLELANLYK